MAEHSPALNDVAPPPLSAIDVPQADRFEIVREVVATVSNGKTSLVDVGAAVSLSARHVKYYLQAARILGFLDDTLERVSASGRALLETPAGGAEELRAIRAGVVGSRLSRAIGDLLDPSWTQKQMIERLVKASGLSRSTAERRARTLDQWRREIVARTLSEAARAAGGVIEAKPEDEPVAGVVTAPLDGAPEIASRAPSERPEASRGGGHSREGSAQDMTRGAAGDSARAQEEARGAALAQDELRGRAGAPAGAHEPPAPAPRPRRGDPRSALESAALFRGFTAEQLTRLERSAVTRRALDREILINEGEPASSMFLVVSGEVGQGVACGVTGSSVDVQLRLGAGSAFGASALGAGAEPWAVVAIGHVELLEWTRARLALLMAEIPAIAEILRARLSIVRRRGEMLEALGRVSTLRDASAAELRRLLDISTLVKAARGEVMCREGEPADAMFIIVSGSIDLEQEGRGAVAALNAGDSFGELALLAGGARLTSAIASRDSELLVIGKRVFDALLAESVSFKRSVRATSRAGTIAPAVVAPHGAASPPIEAVSAGVIAAEPELILVVDRSGLPDARGPRLVQDAIEEGSDDRAEVLLVQRSDGDPVAHVSGSRGVRAVRAADLEAAIEASSSDYVLCVVPSESDPALDALLPLAGAAVILDGGRTEPSSGKLERLRAVHQIAFGLPPKTPLPRARASDLRLVADVGAGAAGGFAELGPDARAAFARLERSLTRRVVGLALGGGGAWGFAHVPLIRGLHRSGIPIDVVAGVSAGSIAGVFYASQGLRGIDRLLEARHEMGVAAAMCVVGTWPAMPLLVRRHVPERRLEDLPLPYIPVAVDLDRGVERAFHQGDLASALRAACAFPGVFGPTLIDGVRYVDGCVKDNVPASCLADWGADFIIASNVVPPALNAPRAPRARGRMRSVATQLSPLHRIEDIVRSIYLPGRSRGATCAAVTFAPDLSEWLPTDFGDARAILAAGELAFEACAERLVERHRASRRRAT